MAFIEVFRNEFTTISMDPKGVLIRMVRSDVPFSSIEALERSIGEMIRTLDGIGRDKRVLMNDLRAITGRNDSTFEARMKILRPRLYGGFVRVGILVRSSVGALQIKRMVQEDGMDRMVMTDEAELIEYLVRG
jgi:hypothetical protein